MNTGDTKEIPLKRKKAEEVGRREKESLRIQILTKTSIFNQEPLVKSFRNFLKKKS